MNSLITYLNNIFKNNNPSNPQYIDLTQYLSPADQAYRDYFLRKDLQNCKLNLIA